MAITVAMRTQVAQLYVSLFGRAPDGEGLGYWVGQLDAGQTLAQVAQSMYNTTPARAYYPAYATNEEIVATFYQNVLGRAVGTDTEGQAYWVAKMNAAGATKGSVITEMLNVVANYTGTDAAGTASKALFNNKVAVAQYYGEQNGSIAGATNALTGVTADVATVATAKTAAAAAAAAATGSTFTLTTGVDTFVGTSGGDTFNATITSTSATLGGLDSVDGGAGSDTLNIADTAVAATAGFALPAGFTATNVETLNVTTNGSIGIAATAFDVSGITGLTKFVGVAAGDGTTDTNVKAANTTDVTLTAGAAAKVTELGGKAVSVTGGATASTITGEALTSVTVKKSAGMTIDNTDTAANGSTTAVGTTLTSVTLDAVNSATAIKGKAITNLTLKNATAGANTITITNGTTGHALTVNVDGAGYDATGTAQVQTVKDAVAAAITVNATGAKSSIKVSTGAADTVLKTANITGSATLALNLDSANNTALATIDGSAATGNLTLTNTAVATSIKTGSGNDTFTSTVVGTTKSTVDSGTGNDTVTLSGGLVAGSTVNLGAGNDTLLGTTVISASTASAVTVVDGGDGTDAVSSALINAGNAAQFKNFEILSLQGATTLDASLLTTSTITGLSVDAASSGTYTGVTSAQSLTDTYVGDNSASTTTLTFSGVTGTADSYTINFAGSTTLTTAATSADTKLGTIAASGIENFTIVSGGDKHWNSMVLGADTSANTVTISGASNLDLTFAANFGSTTSPKTGVTSIDGSAATGKLAITTTNVVNATAGMAVKGGSADDTITTAASQTLTLTGGAGKDNFVVGATVYGTGPYVTTITDIAVGDKITFADLGTETFATAKKDVSAATSLATALGLAIGTVDGSAAGAITWFQYGGNTYIVECLTDDSAGVTNAAATDLVVKLSGLVDLSTATGAGTNVLTIA